jgi:hypothetical protein
MRKEAAGGPVRKEEKRCGNWMRGNLGGSVPLQGEIQKNSKKKPALPP